MRTWLLTSTTYGTWLPGSERGSVTAVRDRRPGEAPGKARREHDQFGEQWEGEIPGLFNAARQAMKGLAVHLNAEAAELTLNQFQETSAYRGWKLIAVSVMSNHFHAIVEAPEEVGSTKILGDLKAYASRTLNRRLGRPESDDWWTRDGSKRLLPDERAVDSAVQYILFKQPNPLVVWCRERGRLVRGEWETSPR